MDLVKSHKWDVKDLQETLKCGLKSQKWASNVPDMGNELADAIRNELRSALLARYGTLEAAAEVLGIPYKTLRRHLTPDSKDRTARVTLDFVLEVTDTLEREAGINFAEIYRRASMNPNVAVSEDDVTLREPRTTYGLAADEGPMKGHQPAADEN